jgi:hypothetical protein
MKRMNAIVKGLRVISASKMSICFLEFANNYYKDGIYFFNKKKYIESFEAFIISWAYIDAGLKLKFFQAPKEQKEWFTA